MATQRALQGRTTTPTPEAQVARESASLTSDLAIVQDDVFALFDDPDARGADHPGADRHAGFLQRLQEPLRSGGRVREWTLKVTGPWRRNLNSRTPGRAGHGPEDHYPFLHLQRAQWAPDQHGAVDRLAACRPAQ